MDQDLNEYEPFSTSNEEDEETSLDEDEVDQKIEAGIISNFQVLPTGHCRTKGGSMHIGLNKATPIIREFK